MNIYVVRSVLVGAILTLGAVGAMAQNRLRMTPVTGTSKVKLMYGNRVATIDLDSELAGTNGTMPGEPPHRYSVLFTAEKNGSLFLVAKVRSSSPVSAPTAPCGGDSPLALIWIKTDKTLKTHEVQAEIFQSCSYNYYDSVIKLSKTGVAIEYDAKKKMRLSYDNLAPDAGLKNVEL